MKNMDYLITLDTGTTNTRAFLWCKDGTLLSSHKIETGVARTAINGNNQELCEGIKCCVEIILQQANIRATEVECILASGMITSDMGLKEVPHLTAPVGLAELAEGIHEASFPNITPIPFFFIPGMENQMKSFNSHNWRSMDIMRGEETEAIALLEKVPQNVPSILVLPGSHTKFIKAENGKLTDCLTTLTGELLSALTQHTLLANTVGKQFVQPESYCESMVRLGYETARKTGLSRAAFCARILKQQKNYTHSEMANYLLGAVLEQDLRALQASKFINPESQPYIILSGKKFFCQAFQSIFNLDKRFSDFVIHWEQPAIPLSAQGALKIYQYRVSN